MARPAKFPYQITIRLTERGGELLDHQAVIMGVAPAVAGRMLIEHPLKGEKIKGPGPVSAEEPKQ